MTTTATSSQAPADVLRDLWSAAGGDLSALSCVLLAGSEPALPSSFRVGTAAQATIAAAGLAAAEVWRQRTKRSQTVSVDVRHAAIEFRSERYMRIDGKPPGPAWDKIAGVYSTGDARKVRLHTNFPHHRDGMLKLLGCGLRARGGAGGARQVGGREARNRCRRSGPGCDHDALARRVGRTPAGAGGGQAPVVPNHKDRRGTGAAAPRLSRGGREAPARRRPRARSDAGDRRPGVRADARGPRCRRHAHNRATPAWPAPARHRHGPRQALGQRRPARHRRSRLAALARARGARVRAGLSPGRCCGTRVLARGARRDAARHRRGVAIGLRARGSMGGPPRLRLAGAERQRHQRRGSRGRGRRRTQGTARAGARSRVGLPDGVRRHDGAAAQGARGRLLARARVAGADRALADEPRPRCRTASPAPSRRRTRSRRWPTRWIRPSAASASSGMPPCSRRRRRTGPARR